MYYLRLKLLSILCFVFFFYCEAYANESEGVVIHEIYEEMSEHDLQYVKNSEINLDNLLINLDILSSQKASKKKYSKFMKKFLKDTLSFLQTKGWSKEESLSLIEVQVSYCADIFFSLKNMHFMKEGFRDYESLKNHEKSKKYFFHFLTKEISYLKVGDSI